VFVRIGCLQRLVVRGVDLRAEVGSSCARSGEVAGEDRLNEGAEDDLSATGHWESKPEDEDELECIVKWEPVDGADSTLKDSEESENDPVSEPLGIIRFVDAEQGLERIVSGNDETSNICKELTTDVEEDEGEVSCDQTEEGIDLRNRCLLLEVVQSWILGKLLINLGDVALSFVLERRHDCWMLQDC